MGVLLSRTHLHVQTIVIYTERLNNSAYCGNIFTAKEQNWQEKGKFCFVLKILDSSHSSIHVYTRWYNQITETEGKLNHNYVI